MGLFKKLKSSIVSIWNKIIIRISDRAKLEYELKLIDKRKDEILKEINNIKNYMNKIYSSSTITSDYATKVLESLCKHRSELKSEFHNLSRRANDINNKLNKAPMWYMN